MEISKKILDKLGVTANTVDVPNTLHEAIEAEKKLELRAMEAGRLRFHKSIQKTKSPKSEKSGKPRETSESVTIYGQQLVQEGLEPLNEAINKYYMEATDGHAKKFATEALILAKCLPNKKLEAKDKERWSAISFMTLKSVLDSITVGSTQTKCVLKIAGSIEDEARLLYFKEIDSKTYSRTREWLRNKGKKNYRHNRRVYNSALRKHNLEYDGFCKEEKVKLGKLLLELLIKTTGFVEFSNKYVGKKILKYVKVTQKTLDWIEKKKFNAEILKPFKLPMIVQPKKWISSPYQGGYYIRQLRPDELSSPIGANTTKLLTSTFQKLDEFQNKQTKPKKEQE